MKKILALILLLVLACSTLTSCEDPEEILAQADAALAEAPYKMTMRMNFECDDDKIDQLFSSMNMVIPVTVDGKNVEMNMKMDVLSYTADINVSIVDMVMYYKISLPGQSVKMKASLNEEQYQEFMADSNAEMMLDPKDFGELTVEEVDGKKHITCGEISEEAKKELNDMIENSLNGLSTDVALDNVTFDVTINDGKYESMNMSCVYSVVIDKKTYKITYNLDAEYSYEWISKVIAPSDANKYMEVDFEQIGG